MTEYCDLCGKLIEQYNKYIEVHNWDGQKLVFSSYYHPTCYIKLINENAA